jgi:glutathione S-transferase
VNINLVKKPEWYLDLNAPGQVPCLQFDDGRCIPESLIVCEYLDSTHDTANRLIPSDAFNNAMQKLAVERFSGQVIANFYKIVRGADEKAISDLSNGLTEFEKKLDGDFLGGKSNQLSANKSIRISFKLAHTWF